MGERKNYTTSIDLSAQKWIKEPPEDEGTGEQKFFCSLFLRPID